MHTATDTTTLRNDLHDKLSALAHNTDKNIIRIELTIEPVNLFDWLTQQTCDKKLYWANRDNEFEIAAVGVAEILKDQNLKTDGIVKQIKQHLAESSEHVQYYGGICFNPDNLDRAWQTFGTSQFFVPRFEICKRNDTQIFACNVQFPKDNIKNILSEFDALNFEPLEKPIALKAPVSRQDFPTKDIWDSIFSKVKEHITLKNLSKVVCARKSTFTFNEPVNPFQLKKHLHAMTPECYHFCFQTQKGTTFLGASPERLFKRQNDAIRSEAIAGTRKTGRTPEEDSQLVFELQSSAKEKLEHALVVETIESQLKKHCDQLHVDITPSVLNLIGIHHLKTSITGLLKENTDDDTLINDLHPTPAVCGLPAKEALKFITEHEPFCRGWYSGLFGYISKDTTELTVAIRSGLIEGNLISLYAGAGIIDKSDQDSEWEEINNKMNHFAKIFEKE